MRSARAVRGASAEAHRAPARSPAISSHSHQGNNATTFPLRLDSSGLSTADDLNLASDRSPLRRGSCPGYAGLLLAHPSPLMQLTPFAACGVLGTRARKRPAAPCHPLRHCESL